MASRDADTPMNTGGILLLAEAMDVGTDAESEQQPQLDNNHIQADGETDPMMRAVEVWAERDRPVNTTKAYGGKMQEFEEYCTWCYRDEELPTLLTAHKVFYFTLYQVMREKRPGGPRKNATSHEFKYFRVEEFDEVSVLCRQYVTELNVWARNGRAGVEPLPPDTINPPGYQMIAQYKNALRNLHLAQQAREWNVAPWEHIWTPITSTVHNIVRKRTDRISRDQFHEKRGSVSLMQFHMLKHVSKIEDEMWKRNADFKTAVKWMMNRFFFVFTMYGLLRGETLFKMEMSDVALVQNQNENDLHPMTVLMTQYSTGKTAKDGKASYGRAARHNDVRCCPVGGLAFYLAMRFAVTREFEPPLFSPQGFLANKNWFNIKLLVNPYELQVGEMAKKNVPYGTYYEEVRALLTQLHLPNNVIAHLGRHLGHRSLELKEVKDTDISKLGNWNQEQARGRFYSAHLPIMPLRQTAMDSKKRKYYAPRTVVEDGLAPLLKETPFSFIYDVLQHENALMAENQVTAFLFIRCMEDLNTVFLQDAAAMWVKYPERRSHVIYTLPVFQKPQWQVSNNRCSSQLVVIALALT